MRCWVAHRFSRFRKDMWPSRMVWLCGPRTYFKSDAEFRCLIKWLTSSANPGDMQGNVQQFGSYTRLWALKRPWINMKPIGMRLSSIFDIQTFIQSDDSDSVEAQGNFKTARLSPGNENRRWHGTRRECNLGDKGHTQFCNKPGCALCCIVRTSFNLACARCGRWFYIVILYISASLMVNLMLW